MPSRASPLAACARRWPGSWTWCDQLRDDRRHRLWHSHLADGDDDARPRARDTSPSIICQRALLSGREMSCGGACEAARLRHVGDTKRVGSGCSGRPGCQVALWQSFRDTRKGAHERCDLSAWPCARPRLHAVRGCRRGAASRPPASLLSSRHPTGGPRAGDAVNGRLALAILPACGSAVARDSAAAQDNARRTSQRRPAQRVCHLVARPMAGVVWPLLGGGRRAGEPTKARPRSPRDAGDGRMGA